MLAFQHDILPTVLGDLFDGFRDRVAAVVVGDDYEITDPDHVNDLALLALTGDPKLITRTLPAVRDAIAELYDADPAAFSMRAWTEAELRRLVLTFGAGHFDDDDMRERYARRIARAAVSQGKAAVRRAAYPALHNAMITCTGIDPNAPRSSPLSGAREDFAVALASGVTPEEAYEAAGYSRAYVDWAARSAAMADRPEVRGRVAYLRKRPAPQHVEEGRADAGA